MPLIDATPEFHLMIAEVELMLVMDTPEIASEDAGTVTLIEPLMVGVCILVAVIMTLAAAAGAVNRP